jgi:L-alanine-DL-glutamate epimerase-like enolase superfamily enzyme
MAITIKVVDFTPRFKGDGYAMSYVTQKALYSRVVKLDAGDGRIGFGEIISDPGLDLLDIRAVEDKALNTLVAVPYKNLPAQIHQLRTKDTRLLGLAFALETAHLDLVARQNSMPLYNLLGGQQCKDVADYLSISCGKPAEMADRVQIDGREHAVIQIKLDGQDMGSNLARIDAVMRPLQAHQTILFDFNGALRIDQAREYISIYSDPRILWEEPCASYAENRELVDKTGARVLFDQCLKSLKDYAQACSEGAMAGACIKPMSLGGLSIAQAAREMCADSGVSVRIDGLWCGPIATASILHLAVGVPADLLIAGCDLREPLELEDDWGGIVSSGEGRIAPIQTPGHGVTPPASLWQ